MTSHMPRRLRGSRPVVGSSRNSTDGFAMRLIAISNRRRMPPENPFTTRSAESARRIDRVARRRANAPLPCRGEKSTNVHKVFAGGESLIDSGVLPGESNTTTNIVRIFTTSIPSMVAVPASGRIKVVSTLTDVVLPAPFGPRSPYPLLLVLRGQPRRVRGCRQIA